MNAAWIGAVRKSTTPKDEWGTAESDYRTLDREFNFTVDAAASPWNYKHIRYWTKEQDGLAQSWEGERVFVNPPYSNIRPWTEKADKREADVAVLLLPATVDVAWFHDFVWRHAEIRFYRGRRKFEGAGSGPAPFPCMVAVYW